MSNLLQRSFTGIIFVVLIVVSVIFNQIIFPILFLLITVAGLWEFYRLVETAGIRPNKIAGVITGAFLFISNVLASEGHVEKEIFLINFVLIFFIFLSELYRKIPNPFTNIAFTFFGILYVALPFSLLNYFPNPNMIPGHNNYETLLGFFFIIWINETGAYLVGSSIGRHRLFERISPKKTWEGTLGGGVLSLLTAFIISRFYTHVSSLDWLIIGIIIVIFSTYGDLFESMFKRSINAKDSGSVLPGHGGILDRFDGVLMAAPFVFVYLFLFKS